MGMSMILVIVIAFSGLKKCKVDHDILFPLSRQSFLCNNNKCLFTEGEESPKRKPLHARGNGREKGGKGGRKEGRKEGECALFLGVVASAPPPPDDIFA